MSGIDLVKEKQQRKANLAMIIDQISIKMIIEFHSCLRNFKLHRSHTSGNPKTTHLRRDSKRLKLLKIHFHWLHLEPLISQAKS